MISVRRRRVFPILAAVLSVAAFSGGSARAEEPVRPPALEQAGFQMHILGYLRVEGLFIQNDPNVDFVGRGDGFRLLNARIGVAGTFRDRVGFRLSADGADDERTSPNAIGGALRFALKDAYADLRFSPACTLRAGQFYTVFDLDELTPQNEFSFADRAVESRGVKPGEGWQTPGLGPGRSLGIAMRGPRVFGGEKVSLGYELAAQNGNGEDQSNNDNDDLAYSGALILGLPRDSVIFAAGRFNRRTVGALPLQQTEEDVSGALAGALAFGPLRFEAQTIFIRTTYPTTGGPVQNSVGAHAELIFRIPTKTPVEFGYRYGFLDPSDLIPTDRVQEHTVGASLLLDEWKSKIQLSITHADEQTGRTLENDRAQLVFQVSL